jgi:RepB DNA-primase from phage plasmid/Primase C terminal 1 (PriCT-1)
METQLVEQNLSLEEFSAAPILFLKTLYQPGDLLCFSFRTEKSWRDVFKRFEEAIEPAFIEALRTSNDSGSDIYVAMNTFSSAHRTIENVKEIRNVWVEIDDNGPQNLDKVLESKIVPKPSVISESSPDKFHVIWSVGNFKPGEAASLNKALTSEFGGDKQAKDLARVLRVPGYRNHKYSDKPVVNLYSVSDDRLRHSFEEFQLESKPSIISPKTELSGSKIPHGEIHGAMLSEAGRLRRNGYEPEFIEVALPVWVQTNCEPPIDYDKVRQCARSMKNYAPDDPWLESLKKQDPPTVLIAGKTPGQRIETQPLPVEKTVSTPTAPASAGSIEEQAKNAAAITTNLLIALEGLSHDEKVNLIPQFDSSVMNGIYADFVELVTRGTTLAPQFAFLAAKTVVGLKMAGNVEFETLDVEPRFYSAFIGETGSGKGEAWRRTQSVVSLTRETSEPGDDLFDGPVVSSTTCGLKIVNSFDSGAGLKDLFFEPPNLPILCFIDEVTSLGNKSRDTKNPDIADILIELADSTSISRVLAKRGDVSGTKTMNNARLGMILCGQDSETYMKAFAGRTKLGLWDRFTPEYGVAQETGDLPKVNPDDAEKLFTKLILRGYSGKLTISADAKQMIDLFWSHQLPEVRKKARWKKHLIVDAYMSAFGRESMVAEMQDVDRAVKIFTRQVIIRKVFFTDEVPDRVGYYQNRIKAITSSMVRQITTGEDPATVAKSRRDFETLTNAYRDNEAHIFERAWNAHCSTWLRKVVIEKSNGQKYDKFLPVIED